jgi:TolB-like protein
MKKIIVLFIFVIVFFNFVIWNISKDDEEHVKLHEEEVRVEAPAETPGKVPPELTEERPVIASRDDLSEQDKKIKRLLFKQRKSIKQILLKQKNRIELRAKEAGKSVERPAVVVMDKPAEKMEIVPEVAALPDAVEKVPEPVKKEEVKPVEAPSAVVTDEPAEKIETEPEVAALPDAVEKVPELVKEEVKPAEAPHERVEEKPSEEVTAKTVVTSALPEEEAPVAGPSLIIPAPPPVYEKEDIALLPTQEVLEMPSPEAGERIVLLPLENLTEEMNIMEHVIPSLLQHLEKNGLSVVHGEDLNNYICKKRVRSAGLVSKELAVNLKDRFHVKAILTGSIVSFSTGENPKFGILLRLIDSSSGAIVWAEYASATGNDFTRIFGLGRINSIYSLIPRVMEKLFSSFSKERLHAKMKSTRKVVVMPFQNNSGVRNAGKIAMYMFLIELLKNDDLEPIEYGNTRKQLINLRIGYRGAMDYGNIKAISEALGAGGVLLGVVESYSDGIDFISSPKVAITARRIDSSKSRIVWYNSRQFSGEDDAISLDWGKIRSVHKIAYKVVAQIVEEMGTAKWQ